MKQDCIAVPHFTDAWAAGKHTAVYEALVGTRKGSGGQGHCMARTNPDLVNHAVSICIPGAEVAERCPCRRVQGWSRPHRP
jgi:hypothetical protein